MKITLSELSTRRIDVEVPVGDRLRTVRLDGLSGLAGEITRGPGGLSLRPLTADEATVALIDWPMTRGQLALDSPAAVTRLGFEAELASGGGFHGRATADAVVARALRLVLGERRFAADARARQVVLEQRAEAGHAACEALELGDFQGALGSVLVRASRALADRLRIDWGTGRTLFSAAAGVINGLALTGANVELESTRVELPSGFRNSGSSVVIPELVVPELVWTIPDVSAMLRREPKGDGAAAAAEPATGAAPRRVDLEFLDRLSGRLDVDLTIDISLPVLGSRRKTHHFRVPIAGGTFNYKELERDLADLEDAFIDIEVRGRQLAIERRIPLIPGLEKPLVLFDLDDREVELARRRLLRLASIATLRRPARAVDGGRSSVQVRELDFAGIDLTLTLAPLPEGAGAGATDAAWGVTGSLRAQGELRFAPGRPLPPTRARISGDDLVTGPAALPIGGVLVEADRVAATRIEAEVTFEGFRPRGGRVVARDVRLSGVRIGPRPPPGAARPRRATTIPPT